MDLDEIICPCTNTTRGMIKDAVDAGAVTLEEVQEATSAGTVCGACVDEIEQFIQELLSEKNK